MTAAWRGEKVLSSGVEEFFGKDKIV